MKISEIAEQFNISSHTLRYYEKIGLIDPVSKNSSGIREYTEHEVGRIKFIICMRSAGLSLENIQKYLELIDEGEHTRPVRLDLLLEQRSELVSRINELDGLLSYLDNKIQNYKEKLNTKQ